MLLMSLIIPQALAVDARAIRDDDYNLLQKGELKSAALTSDGFLLPTYQREAVGDTGSEIVWDTLRETKGTALCATGHQGRLVRVIDETTSKTLADVEEAELTALVGLDDGSVLAAAAPTGRLYRLAADDTLSTYTTLEGVTWVWRMKRSPDGMIWLVTGTEGRLLRLDPTASEPKAEEVAKFKSANLLDLWIDEEGQIGEAGDVFVAGQNPGWLYRYRPSTKKVQVVYNSSAEEIRALVPTEAGLALALNTERSPTPLALSLTLRMAGGATASPAPAAATGGATPAQGADQAKALGAAFTAASGQQYGPARSEIVVLDKRGFARKLWATPERPIHDMALSPEGRLMAAAGKQGRLFEVYQDGSYAVVCDLREDYLMRIKPDEKGYLLATGRNGLIFDMARRRVREATYLSRAMDAGSLVSWGQFYWRGELADGQALKVAFRLGNDGDVQSDFWGEWTKDEAIGNDKSLALPEGPGRYLQYRLTLAQKAKDVSPIRMDYVEAFFIQPNAAPVVASIRVSDKPLPGPAKKPAGATAGGRPSPGASAKPVGGAASATGQSQSGGRAARSNSMNVAIAWQVFDPNQDALQFALYFKAEDETTWKLIDDELRVANLPLNVSGVADGRYRFKVVASDALANMPGEGLTGQQISAEVIVDNTPPQVASKAARVKGRDVTLKLELTDALSSLSAVKMDLDNGDTVPLLPIDGMLDELFEQVEWTLKGLAPGEHVATISVTDRRGNTTVEKMVFMVDK